LISINNCNKIVVEIVHMPV